MSEDDDWFERAVGEPDEEADDDRSATDGETDDRSATDGETDDQSATDGEADDRSATGAESAGTEEADVPTDPPSDAFSGLGDEGTEDDGGGSPFDQDFASAFENAPDPAGGVGGGGAFGSGPEGPGGGPGGGPEGGSADPFDDEEFESAIDRIDLGIEGLDDMILGGVPRRSLISVIGSAGTGKTTFGLQFLNRALADGKRGVYVTLEESTDRIYDTAREKGWSFAEYADEGRLAVVHLDPVEMANSLASIRSDLPDLVKEFGADRLVLDSVSLLEMMYDHPSDRRSEVYQFTRSLKEAGVTTLVTSEASGDNPYNSRYGIIEYLADAVFVLQYVRASDFQETRLAVEIQKIRDANHSRETKPYEITNEGLSVYRQANIF
ncbi:KaiC domain-containing protein [Haloplanus halophilus]|uniref:KaiC domain-containing protein n=1 Tax=Haloplanus halophilus TaxID=2949993 RepID=UPI00203E191E|nr:KaiC domain-containing protein [Haloplanus sp. GDY1]